MSEIFSVQLTAAVNVVLAVGAIVTAVFALFAWQGQRRQLQGQGIQLLAEAAEREREAEERRKAQAVQVYIWQTPPKQSYGLGVAAEFSIAARIRNTSKQPVYDLRLAWLARGTQHGSGTLRVAPLLPDEEDTSLAAAPLGFEPDDLIAIAVFRDRSGRWWRTRSDGILEETSPGDLAQRATPTVPVTPSSLPPRNARPGLRAPGTDRCAVPTVALGQCRDDPSGRGEVKVVGLRLIQRRSSSCRNPRTPSRSPSPDSTSRPPNHHQTASTQSTSRSSSQPARPAATSAMIGLCDAFPY